MGPDFFAVLKQKRRPWIDSDQLKQEYQQRTFAAHPDRTKGADADVDFATITEAYRVLNSPRLRLQHLLALEDNDQPRNEPIAVPSALSDLFMQAAQLVGEIDALLQKREQTSSTLGKSLLQSQLADVRTRATALVKTLEMHYAGALNDLRAVDQTWAKDRNQAVVQVRSLTEQFAFLERWLDQMREKEFRLSS